MIDITSITAGVSAATQALELIKVLRNADTNFDKAEVKNQLAELYGIIADLKVNLAEFKVQMIDKDSEVRSLKEQINLKNNLFLRGPFYYEIVGNKELGPYCQQCFDSDKKQINLYKVDRETFHCKTCDNWFNDYSKSKVRQRLSDHEYDPFE